MTTKQYLEQIERLDRMIQNKLSEINQLRIMAYSITVAPKDVDVQSSGAYDKLGETVAKIVDLENKTDKLVDKYIDERIKIIGQIDRVSELNFYHVLSLRYVARKNLDEIAYEMGYSRTQINRIHSNALVKFEDMYGSEYMDKDVVQDVT